MKFRLWSIRFDVSFYFFALLAAFFVLEPDSITACGAAAALLHECGHLTAMLLVPGGHVEQVSVTACGLRIRARLLGQHKGWLPVCLAGAAANFLTAVITMPLGLLINSPFFAVLASANIFMGAVNLLPVEPMDGGQALRALMLRRYSPETADRICATVSLAVLIPLIAVGLWLLMRTQYNFSLLLLGLWLLGGVLGEYF